MLIDDIESWWSTLLEIRFGREEPTWGEFIEHFRQTFVPQTAKERRVREFLELAQGSRTLTEYINRF